MLFTKNTPQIPLNMHSIRGNYCIFEATTVIKINDMLCVTDNVRRYVMHYFYLLKKSVYLVKVTFLCFVLYIILYISIHLFFLFYFLWKFNAIHTELDDTEILTIQFKNYTCSCMNIGCFNMHRTPLDLFFYHASIIVRT